VCVHPAFRAYLPSLTAALAPALAAVAGLPGAPVRISQQATTFYLNSVGLQTPRIDAVSSGNPRWSNCRSASTPEVRLMSARCCRELPRRSWPASSDPAGS
jgi:type IV secretory pathway protease TraF